MLKVINAVSSLLLCSAIALPGMASANESQDAKPIREATLKVQIFKGTYTKEPDGTYRFNSDLVCEKSGAIDVYDNRGTDRTGGVSGPIPSLNCASTMGNKPVHFVTGSEVNINRSLNLFSKKMEDSKVWTVFVAATDANRPDSDFKYLHSSIGTKDLNAKSLMTSMMPTDLSTCTKPECRNAPRPDMFYAIVELEDAP